MKQAYRILFRKGLMVEEAVMVLANECKELESIRLLVDFVNNSKRGFVRATSDRSDDF